MVNFTGFITLYFRIVLLSIIVLNNLTISNAQETIPVKRLKLQHFGIDDGLSQSYITALTQDIHGFMWFATKDGLNKYDGREFTVFRHTEEDTSTLCDNNIFNIYADSRGLIWISYFNHRIDVLNPETGSVRHLTDRMKMLFEGQEPIVNVWSSIGEDTFHNLYFYNINCYVKISVKKADDSAIGYDFEFEDQRDELPSSIKDEQLYAPYITNAGNMYVSTMDSVYIYDTPDLKSNTSHRSHHYTKFAQHHESNIPGFEKLFFFDLRAEDTINGQLFFRQGYGFSIYNTKTNVITDTLAPTTYGNNYFGSTCFDKHGKAWISTMLGLMVYDPELKKYYKVLSEDTSISDNMLSNAGAFIDRGGVVWIATNGYGLFKYDPRTSRFNHLQRDSNNDFSVQTIIEDHQNDRLWLVSMLAMGYYQRNGSKFLETLNLQEDNFRKSFVPYGELLLFENDFLVCRDGYLIHKKNEGLILFDKKFKPKGRWNQDIISFKDVMLMHEDRDGNYCIAGVRGGKMVLVIQPPDLNEIPVYFDIPQLFNNTYFPYLSKLIRDENGHIWLASVTGLFELNPSTAEWRQYHFDPGNANSLPSDVLLTLCEDPFSEHELWIGTWGAGMVKFNMETRVFTRFNSQNSQLPNDVIYGILSDDSGKLWISSNAGLTRFDTQQKIMKTYTAKDGLQSNEFNRYAYLKLSTGELAFGGINGLNIFKPDDIKDSEYQPNVLLTGLKLNNKLVIPNDTTGILHLAIYATDKIFLDYDQNYLTFSFVSTDYSESDRIYYQYKMIGIDDDWQPSTTLNEATYTNLDPGEYEFRVRGTNADGLYSAQEASVFISIASPWWATWWFRSLVVLLVLLIIYGIYRYRLAQATKLLQLRNRIANDLHDEIGSTLSSISISSTVIQNKMGGRIPEVKPLLDQISTNTDNMMEAMSDIIWAINTKNDRFDNIVFRMRSFANEILEPKDCRINIEVSQSVSSLNLDMVKRKNIYLVFKEAINNIAKYAEAKEVSIRISADHNQLVMVISDDGKGFDTQVEFAESGNFGGNGLQSMNKRAIEISGKLSIESRPGDGTRIVLTFPL